MSSRLPLVLLPGLLCDAALWQHQIRALSDSAAPQVAETHHHGTLEAIAHDVLAAAPPRFALAGLSMGGYVAFEILRQAPERVLKLCLLNTSARPDTREQSERRRMLLALSRSGQFKGVTPRLLPMLVAPERVGDTDLSDIIMAMAERMGREAFANQQTAILHRIDSRPTLRHVRCPTQVIGGTEDQLTPVEVVREIAEGIPNAHVDLIEHCGHLSPLERPERVTTLMRRWLIG